VETSSYLYYFPVNPITEPRLYKRFSFYDSTFTAFTLMLGHWLLLPHRLWSWAIRKVTGLSRCSTTYSSLACLNGIEELPWADDYEESTCSVLKCSYCVEANAVGFEGSVSVVGAAALGGVVESLLASPLTYGVHILGRNPFCFLCYRLLKSTVSS